MGNRPLCSPLTQSHLCTRGLSSPCQAAAAFIRAYLPATVNGIRFGTQFWSRGKRSKRLALKCSKLVWGIKPVGRAGLRSPCSVPAWGTPAEPSGLCMFPGSGGRASEDACPCASTCATESPDAVSFQQGSLPSAALHMPRNPQTRGRFPGARGSTSPTRSELRKQPGSCLVSSHPRLPLPEGTLPTPAWPRRVLVCHRRHSCPCACCHQRESMASRDWAVPARGDSRPS